MHNARRSLSGSRNRLVAQTCVAAACTLGGLAYPISVALTDLRLFGQVGQTGPAVDALVYDPPAYAIVATLILLPIGVIVGFVTAVELASIRRRRMR